MRHFSRITLPLLLAIGCWLCSAHAAPVPFFIQSKTYELRGTVESVSVPTKRAVIKHEAVRELMDAMTMSFLIKDQAALNSLAPGDQIRARLVVSAEGAMWLEKLEILGRADPQSDTRKGGTSSQATEPVNPRLIDADGLYTCSMHLDYRTKNAGKCPRCGMALITVTPQVPEDFQLDVKTLPHVVRPLQKITLHLSVLHPRTGKRVSQFALMHDRLFHLFLVSQDLSDFQHIHPRQLRDGSFVIQTVLKRDGLYKVFADFYPLDGAPQMIQAHVITAGWQGSVFAGQVQLQPDSDFTKKVIGTPLSAAVSQRFGVDLRTLDVHAAGATNVRLESPRPLISGQTQTIKFHLTDPRTNQLVTDLIPYLSAWGHLFILNEAQTDPVHSHPEKQIDFERPAAQQRGAGDLSFEVLFPAPGRYRIWLQFLRGRQLYTVFFDVNVTRY